MRLIRYALLVSSAVSALAVAAAMDPAAAQSQLPRPTQLPPAGGPSAAPPAASTRPAPPPAAQPKGALQAQPGPAQGSPGGLGQVAPAKPYKPVAVTIPQPVADPSFDAFRKQLGEIAGRKDRASLAALVAPNFFVMGEQGDTADKKKSGIDNLAAAIGLDASDGSGWETLSGAARDSTLQPLPQRKGLMCGPATPSFDDKAFEQLLKSTGTDGFEWGYPAASQVEVQASSEPNAPVIERLGPILVRILPDMDAGAAALQSSLAAPPPMQKVVTPSGKTGFVAADALNPLIFDQVCYVKDAGGAWKIGGYIGGD